MLFLLEAAVVAGFEHAAQSPDAGQVLGLQGFTGFKGCLGFDEILVCRLYRFCSRAVVNSWKLAIKGICVSGIEGLRLGSFQVL